MTFDRPIYVIAGPTASGKSSLAIQLAKEINGVIINADSRQIYKELNIGTAKPTPDRIVNEKEWKIENISHFLYGFVSIKTPYNLYEYQKDVQSVLDSLLEDKTPILVGGTGLYIDSIIYNYILQKNSANPTERGTLEKKSLKDLQAQIEPNILNSLNDSDRNNPVRLIRILEKGSQTLEKGQPLDFKYFVLDIQREVLRDRISQRVDQMFDHGLLEEVQELHSNGFFEYPILNKTIGYQEFEEYFEDKIDLEDVKKKIVTNTNRYAKRQRTWFRRNSDAIYVKNIEDILNSIN